LNTTLVRTYALLLLLISATHPGYAVESRAMDVQSMQQDLRFVQTKLNTIHPEPYHHLGKDEFDAMVDRLVQPALIGPVLKLV